MAFEKREWEGLTYEMKMAGLALSLIFLVRESSRSARFISALTVCTAFV